MHQNFIALDFGKFTEVKIEIYSCKYSNFTAVNFGKPVKYCKTMHLNAFLALDFGKFTAVKIEIYSCKNRNLQL